MKPYDFVPLNQTVEKKPIRRRDQLLKENNHGKWIIKAKTITPVTILTGRLTYQEGQLAKGLITDCNGDPILVGSSLKGVIRSIYESITYSCIQPPNHKKKYDYLPKSNNRVCSGDMVCSSCQLFGYVGEFNKEKRETFVARSLIKFSDLHLVENQKNVVTYEEIPNLYQPLRFEDAVWRYIDEDEYFQRKFYKHGKPQKHDGAKHQVIRESVEFIGEITYENLTDEDLANLMFAFGFGEKPFILKIGYGKPAYYGSIQFTLEKIQPYSSPFVQSKEISQEQLIKISDDLSNRDSRILNQKKKIVEIFKYEGNENREWEKDYTGRKGY